MSPEVVLCAAGDIPMMETVAAAAEAIARVPRLSDRAPALVAECESEIEASASYAHDHLEGHRKYGTGFGPTEQRS